MAPVSASANSSVMSPRASSVRTTESTLTARMDATWLRVTGCLYAMTASVSSAACDSRDGACPPTNSLTRSSSSSRTYSRQPPPTSRSSKPRTGPPDLPS